MNRVSPARLRRLPAKAWARHSGEGFKCEGCGSAFPSLRSLGAHSRKDRPECAATLADRFWRHVDKSGGPDACWPWTGVRASTGYGMTNEETLPVGAHRVSLALALGRPLRPGMLACHRCDNKPCVNPAHLYEGTAADNSRDALARGRRTRKLTPDLIAEVQRDHAAGEPIRALGRRYGVAATTARRYIELGQSA